MRIPSFKPRNLAAGLLTGALVVAGALVIAQDQETLRVRTPLAADDPRFPEYLTHLLGAPLTSGDAYTVHTNGDAAFPAMLNAISRAQHRVSFETYVYDSGEVAGRFTSAFEAAARRGVEVRLVLDSGGAQQMSPEHVDRLTRAGCRIAWVNSVGSLALEDLNYRTHRKSLIIDGNVAFIGGIGIADQWEHVAKREPRWRDTQVEVRGPAAVYIEKSFNENWIESGAVVEPDLFPHDDRPAGPARSIVVWSGPKAAPA